MCGRFTLRASAELVAGEFLVILLEPVPPRYNIAPGQAILVVCGFGAAGAVANRMPASQQPSTRPGGPSAVHWKAWGEGGPAGQPPVSTRQLVWMQWGFRPGGASARPSSSRLINLRTETALENPRFRTLLQSQRCVILADGFYEWQKIGGSRQPFFLHRKDDRPFGMAGLWKMPEPETAWTLPECVILTTPANAVVGPIHERMPALLLPEHYALWLDTAGARPQELAAALRPYPAELLEAYPVSELVNSVVPESPECIVRQDRPIQRNLFDPAEE